MLQDLQQTINPATGLPEIDQYTFLNWFTTEGVYEEVGGDPIAEIIRNQIWGDPLSVYYAEVRPRSVSRCTALPACIPCGILCPPAVQCCS